MTMKLGLAIAYQLPIHVLRKKVAICRKSSVRESSVNIFFLFRDAKSSGDQRFVTRRGVQAHHNSIKKT